MTVLKQRCREQQASDCVRVEQAVMQKRFNELGAMLLSELVQQLSDTLSEPIRGGSVRKELGRLRQLTFILNAGTVREAVGLLMSGNTPLGGGSMGGGLLQRVQCAPALHPEGAAPGQLLRRT